MKNLEIEGSSRPGEVREAPSSESVGTVVGSVKSKAAAAGAGAEICDEASREWVAAVSSARAEFSSASSELLRLAGEIDATFERDDGLSVWDERLVPGSRSHDAYLALKGLCNRIAVITGWKPEDVVKGLVAESAAGESASCTRRVRATAVSFSDAEGGLAKAEDWIRDIAGTGGFSGDGEDLLHLARIIREALSAEGFPAAFASRVRKAFEALSLRSLGAALPKYSAVSAGFGSGVLRDFLRRNKGALSPLGAGEFPAADAGRLELADRILSAFRGAGTPAPAAEPAPEGLSRPSARDSEPASAPSSEDVLRGDLERERRNVAHLSETVRMQAERIASLEASLEEFASAQEEMVRREQEVFRKMSELSSSGAPAPMEPLPSEEAVCALNSEGLITLLLDWGGEAAVRDAAIALLDRFEREFLERGRQSSTKNANRGKGSGSIMGDAVHPFVNSLRHAIGRDPSACGRICLLTHMDRLVEKSSLVRRFRDHLKEDLGYALMSLQPVFLHLASNLRKVHEGPVDLAPLAKDIRDWFSDGQPESAPFSRFRRALLDAALALRGDVRGSGPKSA